MNYTKHVSILILMLTIICTASIPAQAKEYKIATLHDYYPYSKITESGEASGILVEWWEEWSRVTGIEVRFYPMDPETITAQLKAGDIDIIAGLYYTEKRATYLKFGDPIIRMQTALFFKDELAIDSIQSVSVTKSSVAEAYLRKNYPNLILNEVTSLSLLREEVSFNQVDGFVYDIPNPIGKYKGINAPDGYYQYSILFTDKIRPCVLFDNAVVMNDIIEGSNRIETETLIGIAQKYDLYEPVTTNWTLIIGLAIIGLLVILLLLVIIHKQKNKVRQLRDFENNTDWQVILDKGENDLIEFKSSLRWDYREEKPNKVLEMVIVKTLSAFLNTQGGMLFIGVDDDGKALGLEQDYNSFSKKSRDGFLLALTNLVNQHLGKRIHQFITMSIISINDKDVCIVNMEKSDKPVFLGKGDKEEFYIRTSAASQPLGIRESYEYIRSNWD